MGTNRIPIIINSTRKLIKYMSRRNFRTLKLQVPRIIALKAASGKSIHLTDNRRQFGGIIDVRKLAFRNYVHSNCDNFMFCSKNCKN